MKKIAVLLLLISSTIAASAQKVLTIDFDQVKKAIEDPKSNMYYPTLLARFEQGDSMSAEELKHVYYGGAFSKHYDPYAFKDKLSFDKLYDAKKFRRAAAEGLRDLAGNPISLKLTLRMIVCYVQIKDEDSVQLFTRRYNGLLAAIYNSGEGTSQDKAMIVLDVDDEYAILREGRLTPQKQIFYDGAYGPTDKIVVERNNWRSPAVEALYFNITIPSQKLDKRLKRKGLLR